MTPQTWRLRYTVEFGEWKEDELNLENQGLTDSIIICSIMGGNGEGTSHAFFGVNGKTKQLLDDIDLFRAWAVLAAVLSKSSTVNSTRRGIAAAALKNIRAEILGIEEV